MPKPVKATKANPKKVKTHKAKTSTRLIEVRGQKLMTSSMVIAEIFNRPHKSVLRSLDKLGDRHKFVPIFYVGSYGIQQTMYLLDEMAFLIAMALTGMVA